MPAAASIEKAEVVFNWNVRLVEFFSHLLVETRFCFVWLIKIFQSALQLVNMIANTV